MCGNDDHVWQRWAKVNISYLDYTNINLKSLKKFILKSHSKKM